MRCSRRPPGLPKLTLKYEACVAKVQIGETAAGRKRRRSCLPCQMGKAPEAMKAVRKCRHSLPLGIHNDRTDAAAARKSGLQGGLQGGLRNR